MTAEPFDPAAEPFEILGSTVRAELHILGGTFVIERRRRRRVGLRGLRWAMARS
jgi:hypothetical protein